MSQDAKPIDVAVGILMQPNGDVLLGQRPEGKPYAGYWEFPGGKVEPGEGIFAALQREFKEELGIEVAQACLAPFVFASHGYDSFHLLMPVFLCRRWTSEVRRLEHEAIAWVRPQKFSDYPMPPADAPIAAWLCDLL